MNRQLFSMILAMALAAVSPRLTSAQAVVQRCDKPVADAEFAVRQVGACFDSLVASKAALAEPVALALIDYAAFSAYASGGADACAPQPYASWVDLCRSAVLDMVAARAAMGSSAEFVAACTGTDLPKNPAESKKRSECCALSAENRGRPNPCANLVPRCESDMGACQAYFSSLKGDAADCKKIVPGNDASCASAADCQKQQADCRGTALFVKAFKASNIELCGASDYCRVLMGAGKKVVQDRAAQLLKTPAGRWYVNREWKPIIPRKAGGAVVPSSMGVAAAIRGFTCEEPVGSPENRNAVAPVLAAARSCLATIEMALPQVDLATGRKIDDLTEKLIRAGIRLDAYFSGVAAVQAKPVEKRAP